MADSNLLALINGVPRGQVVLPLIYDQTVSIVASGGSPPSSINGPVSSGTGVTLPSSQTYTLNSNSVANLQIYLNGDRLEQVLDWTTSGSGPNYTAVQFTFQLNALDVLVFRIERSS
jgi:hypothetical protein